MKNSTPLIEDIMNNPEKIDYGLSEKITRLMADRLVKQIDADVKKYFPIHQYTSIENNETEIPQSPYVTKRYIDQFLEKSKNGKFELSPERNKIEEMINYGKDDEEY